MITLQCTLFSSNGYRPMSTLVNVDSVSYYNQHSKEVKAEAIQRICAKRYMNKYHLKQYGYDKIKVRVYQKPIQTIWLNKIFML